MEISHEETRHIARLARLHLDPQQVDPLARQLGAILGYIRKLDELDTTNIQPTSHALDVHNVWRPDVVGPVQHDRDLLFQAAPRFEQGFYVVPKVIE